MVPSQAPTHPGNAKVARISSQETNLIVPMR